ncbi:MAG: efflux RND transporter periplasmic adaptor subunit [Elusimicrobia bacterium]|nr:efflux RND transporter periplasmic adaptor subunit [Elusimicrobiota bacterium]
MKTTRLAAVVLAGAALGAGAAYLWRARRPALPETIASGNGRLEAQEVHVASKTGGRVLEVPVAEGDFVSEGQVLARLDTRELAAALRRAEAERSRAVEGVAEARARAAEADRTLSLAAGERTRALALLKRGSATVQEADRRRADYDVAVAAAAAARARISAAEHGVEAASAEAARIETLVADAVIRAPLAGRVQYRLAEPGEVLAPGARVVTLLDLQNVYMTVFLPTAQAGKVAPGADARIVLDALPGLVVPAKVTFVASEAQFTPREVETRTEREKLMFRVKVGVPRELLRRRLEKVRTGLPGVAYVALSPDAPWPAWLAVNVPP